MELCVILVPTKSGNYYSKQVNMDLISSEFHHSKCDDHENTLSLFKVDGNGFIFRAFTAAT